jgi:hypothetical protein
MSEIVVHLDGLVVGPDQWLVLITRQAIDTEAIDLIREQVPDALRGRVLVVDRMTGYVVDARADSGKSS